MKVHIIALGNKVMKVEILKIKIDGFKNIKNTEIKLDKITSLLSVNSYGKSNFLEAMDFGFFFIKANPKHKKQMMSWKGGYPLNKKILMNDYKFEIQCIMEKEDKKIDIIYGYSFKWAANKKSGKIIAEYLKIKNLEDSQKYSSYISRNEEGSYHKTSLSGRCDKEIRIDDSELIINKLMAFDNLFYVDVIKEINDINIYIDRHFDPRQSYEIPFIPNDYDELSLSDNKDIPRVLFFLKQQYINKYNLIINTLKELFPFIEDIYINEFIFEDTKSAPKIHIKDNEFAIVDKMYILHAKHKNLVSPIRFIEMSDGVRRVLLLLTYLVLAEINNYSLIAIEEPENSINPGLLKKYIIALDNFVDKTKILITSHSPFLINYINPASLYLGVPNKYGLANFRKVKSSSVTKLYDAAEDLNVLVGEYLFDLMSGIDEDNEILNKYLENE